MLLRPFIVATARPVGSPVAIPWLKRIEGRLRYGLQFPLAFNDFVRTSSNVGSSLASSLYISHRSAEAYVGAFLFRIRCGRHSAEY